MAEQLAQGYALLTVGGEFRPDPGHRTVEFQLALRHQLQRRYRREGLGAGKQIDQSILLPHLFAGVVGHASPQVDDGFATQLDAYCRAALRGLFEQFAKRLPDRFETKIEISLNVQSRSPSLYSM